MKSLVTKNQFIELVKNKYPVANALESYEALPEIIVVDKEEYKLNNVVTITDDKIESVELNYYCKDCYKFLFSYKTEISVMVAINNLVKEYNNYQNKLNGSPQI